MFKFEDLFKTEEKKFSVKINKAVFADLLSLSKGKGPMKNAIVEKALKRYFKSLKSRNYKNSGSSDDDSTINH